jgi:hypothetical protein
MDERRKGDATFLVLRIDHARPIAFNDKQLVHAAIAAGHDRRKRHPQAASAAIPLVDDLAALRGLQLERTGTGGRQPHRTPLVGSHTQISQSTAVLALLRSGGIRGHQPSHTEQQRERRQPLDPGQRQGAGTVIRHRGLATDDRIAHGALRSQGW